MRNLLVCELHDLCGAGLGRVAVGLYDAQTQTGRRIMLGAVKFLGKLQPKNVESVARRAQREPQRSRRLALAVACIDLNLADLQ